MTYKMSTLTDIPPLSCKSKYRHLYRLYQRKRQYDQLKAQYPSKIIIIAEPSSTLNTDIPTDKCKYAIDPHMTVGQFAVCIQKHVGLSTSGSPLTLSANKTILSEHMSIHQVYIAETLDGDDDFLYIEFA
jgi:hypothetical protein